MRFRLGAKIKQGTLWLILLAIVTSSLLSSAVVLLPQRAHAAVGIQDFNYHYIVSGGRLLIRAYLPDDCGSGAPSGPAAIEFGTLDGINFGASQADFGCMDGGNQLVNGRQQNVEEVSGIFAIYVGQRERDAETRGSDWPEVGIDIGHPERAQAWKRCVEQGEGGVGEGAQNCVEREIEEILAAQAEEDAADGEGRESCEDGGWSLNWMFCPLLFAADGIMRRLDEALVSLLSIPNDYYTDGSLERAWSRMRNIAYIILVPITLVMVIGTALNFDFISAYTVKRAMPRLVIAAIFIALSFEITKFLVIVTNDVGKGIAGIVLSAFANADEVTIASVFSPDNGDSLEAAPIFLTAVGLGAAAIGSLGIILSYIFVAVLALAIGFFLLSFRQMLIIALMLVAPLAILAWIFPGNDKLWKLWWGTFSKLLLLFPLIMLLIAVGKSFASLVADTADGNFVSTLLKLAAYVGPYFMIPATFKFAGGIFATISGMANDRSRGLLDRNRAYRQKEIGQNMERRVNRRLLERRADLAGRLEASSSKRGRFGAVGAFGKRFAANRIGGYNIHAARSAKQAEVAKEINDQIATGRDDDIRGLTAAHGYKMGFNKAQAAGLARVENGVRQYKTLGGKWVDEANVAAGVQRWGNDRFAQQAAVSYEMRKAQTDEEVNGIAQNYGALAKAWGMNGAQATGAWVGPAFENQNKHLQFKYTSFDDNGNAKINYAGLSKEVYENRGSYNMSQMNAGTIRALGDGYRQAQKVVESTSASQDEKDAAIATQQRVRAAAETFMSRYGGGEQMVGMDEERPVMQGAPGGGRGESFRTMTQGAGHVAEEVRQLASDVGVYGPRDTSRDPKTTIGPFSDRPQG